MWGLPPTWTSLIDRVLHHKPAPSAKPQQSAAGPAMPPDQLNLSPQRPQGPTSGRIALDSVKGQYIKDPSFVNNGQPVGGHRYVAFGDLGRFYLKEFSVDGHSLSFKGGELPISINGLPPNLNSPWAPQIVVNHGQVQLFYTAGTIDPGKGIDWPSYRLHMASMPVDEFVRQAKEGKGVSFQDQGTLFDDQTSFGGAGSNFGMIDPQYYVNPQGEAYLTYTVVTPAADGQPHQEFVRSRRVDPNDPRKALGPDTALVDGWAGGPHDGVAEAQDVVNVNGQPYLFVSSRAGDKDQRVLFTPVSPKLDAVIQPEQLRPLLMPGAEPWRSDAVGSTSAAVIDGKPYMIYQGMDANHQFSLGWTTPDLKG